jgi:hypothetical protein
MCVLCDLSSPNTGGLLCRNEFTDDSLQLVVFLRRLRPEGGRKAHKVDNTHFNTAPQKTIKHTWKSFLN